MEKYEVGPSQWRIQQFLQAYGLTDLLPYECYDPTSDLFFNKKSIGFVLELQPLTTANAQIADALTVILAEELPQEGCLQLLLHASPKIGNILESWLKARGDNPLYQHLANKRAKFFQAGAFQSLTPVLDHRVRDYRLFLSFGLAKKRNSERLVQTLIQVRAELLASFNSFGIHGSTLPIDSFLNCVHDLLYPSTSVMPAKKLTMPRLKTSNFA